MASDTQTTSGAGWGLVWPGVGFKTEFLDKCTPEAECGEEYYEERKLKGGADVELLYPADDKRGVQVVGTGVIKADGEGGGVQRFLHNHGLDKDGNETGARDAVVLWKTCINEKSKALPYPFKFKTNDVVPKTLGNISKADLFVWDMRAVRVPGSDPPAVVPPRQPVQLPPETQPVIEVSDDEPELPGDEEGTTIDVTGFDLNDYKFTEVYVLMKQIKSPEILLRSVERAFVDQLKADMRARGWSASSGTMSVTMTLEQCKLGVKPESLWRKNELGCNVMHVEEDCRLVDGGHRKQSVVELGEEEPKEDDNLGWTKELFPTHFYERKDGKPIGTFELMKLSKVCNNRSSTVRVDCTFVDHISNLMNYSILFEEHYSVPFLEARTVDILKDLKVSSFNDRMGSARNTRRYIFIARLFIKHDGVFPKVVTQIRKANKEKVGNAIGAAHFEAEKLRGASKEVFELFIDSLAHYLLEPPKSNQNGPLDVSKLLEYTQRTYDGLKDMQRSRKDMFPTIAKLYDLKVYVRRKDSVTVKVLILNNIRVSPMPMGTSGNVSNKRDSAWEKNYNAVLDMIKERLDPGSTQKKTSGGRGSIGEDSGNNWKGGDGAHRASKRRKIDRIRERAMEDEEIFMATTQSRRRLRSDVQRSTIAAKGMKTLPAESSTQRQGGMKQSSNTVQVLSADEYPEGSGVKSKPVSESPPKSVSKGRRRSSKRKGGKKGGPTETVKRGYTGLHDSDITYDDRIPQKAPPGYEKEFAVYRKKCSEEVHLTEADLKNVMLPMSVRNREEEREVFGENTMALLRCFHIPPTHMANVFVDSLVVQFYRRLVWFFATYETMKGAGMGCTVPIGEVDVNEVFKHYLGPLGMATWAKKRGELLGDGYTVFEGWSDPGVVKQATRTRMLEPPVCREKTMPDLFNAVIATFDAGTFVKKWEDNPAKVLWHPILNYDDHERDKEARDRDAWRATSSTVMTSQYFFESKERVWMGRYRAMYDLWLAMIIAHLQLPGNEGVDMYVPPCGGRWLMTGVDSPAQVGHNDYHTSFSKDAGYFLIASMDEPFSLWVSKGSHHFVFYEDVMKRSMCNFMTMQKVEVPARSVFIGHGFVQHAGSEWTGSHCPRYHMYCSPKSQQITDQVAFAFGESFRKEGEPCRVAEPNTIPVSFNRKNRLFNINFARTNTLTLIGS